MVMLICIDAFDSIVFLEVVIDQKFKNFGVYGNLAQTHKDPSRDPLMSDLVEPGVLADVSDFVSFFRVSVQNILEQVFPIRRNKMGNFVLSIQNFLIEIGCIGIFKW